jgi:glucuronate isomerase
MDQHFMLKNPTALRLYEEHAKEAPIYDYHCHLSAKEIREDRPFDGITALWLGHDHYKWRAMRFAGVGEHLITGEADPREKFKAWAQVCGRLIGSPLYHWTKLELSTYFGVTEPLNERTADRIYDHCNRVIERDRLSPHRLITASNVRLICTTDDPVDDLADHQELAAEDRPYAVLPTFRPDRVFKLDASTYPDYIKTLGESAGVTIRSYASLKQALENRIDFFAENGCLLADHSLERLVITGQEEEGVDAIFRKAMASEPLTVLEIEQFKNHTLTFLATCYEKRDWTLQLHIGALRNTNREMHGKLGADTGFDVMNDFPVATYLSELLKTLHSTHHMPRIILYTLNDKDNLVLSTLPHCFSQAGIGGKVQFGAPWWFNDHKDGFIRHFTALGNQGMLADFIGMLTDSRSFLSYTRHDYFRRILCSFVGELVESGEFEDDERILGEIIEGISHRNIIRYLGLDRG